MEFGLPPTTPNLNMCKTSELLLEAADAFVSIWNIGTSNCDGDVEEIAPRALSDTSNPCDLQTLAELAPFGGPITFPI